MDAKNPYVYMLSDYSRQTDVSTSNFIHTNQYQHFRRRAVPGKERLLKYAQDRPDLAQGQP